MYDVNIFGDEEVRRVFHNSEWWFVVEDVVLSLTTSQNSNAYIVEMLSADEVLKKSWNTITKLIDVEADGTITKVYCANLQGVFRIIQSINSPKTEPFKLWMAKLAKERIDELRI
jgi:prophage antirepressor-like protein